MSRNRRDKIPIGDRLFLANRAMTALGVRAVILAWSDSRERHPDIWVTFERSISTIWVTREWRRQHFHERRKRLVHELLHCKGEKHGRKTGELVYSPYPRFDSYSRAIYEVIK